MSRHNVTYKPGGAITKGLDLTLKMQRVIPVAEVAECQACPACPETPPLVGVWVDSIGDPMLDMSGALVSNIDLQASRISEWCTGLGTCFTTLTGFFLYVARFVNVDFIDAGLAAPLLIDESLCRWNVVWAGSGDQPLVSISGSSIAVAYTDFIGSGVLTITPEYDGVTLPDLTLTVTTDVVNNCA